MKKTKEKLIILLFGPPGSGKGTQAKLLCKKFKLEYFGSGEELRKRQKINDFTGKKLKKVMNRGEWVPETTIIKIWLEKLEEFKKKRNFRGMVYDGGTRRMLEAQLFNIALKWYEWDKYLKVIYLWVSEKEAFNRLTKRRQCKRCGEIIPWIGKFKEISECPKCGGELIYRPDDKIPAIKKRLEEFKKHTIPVINYFKKQGKLIKINGEQPIEKVFQDILKALEKRS
jgi:adenylate kinase